MSPNDAVILAVRVSLLSGFRRPADPSPRLQRSRALRQSRGSLAPSPLASDFRSFKRRRHNSLPLLEQWTARRSTCCSCSTSRTWRKDTSRCASWNENSAAISYGRDTSELAKSRNRLRAARRMSQREHDIILVGAGKSPPSVPGSQPFPGSQRPGAKTSVSPLPGRMHRWELGQLSLICEIECSGLDGSMVLSNERKVATA